jgi:hypothetical protein
MERRPTLLHSCARAATAAEARFRVDYPNSRPRASRIVALDAGAAAIVQRVAGGAWRGARFFTYLAHEPAPSLGSLPVDAILRATDGTESRLSEELEGADLAVMIASSDDAAEAASVIGNACAARGMAAAALVVCDPRSVDATVSALRPHASVLVVSRDEEYVPEMLSALRA